MATSGRKTSTAAERRRREAAARGRTAATVQLLHESLDHIDTPQRWEQILAATARLQRLTFANTVLAVTQRPDITDLRSYDEWLTAGRQVQKGATGVRILVPKKTAVTGLAGTDGPMRIDGIDTTVVFDTGQTKPINPGSDQAGVLRPARYRPEEVLRVLGSTPAGAKAPEAARTDAVAMIRYHVWRGLDRIDAQIAHDAAICAEHLVRAAAGLEATDAALQVLSQWEGLPVSQRRRRMIDVGNHAARCARPIIGLLHAGGVEADTRRAADAAPNRQASTEKAPGTGPAAEAMAAVGTDLSDPAVLAAVNADAWEYFRQQASSSEIVGDYLAQRGIATTEELPVGYAPIDVRLGAHLRSLGYSDEAQIAAGVSRRRSDGRVVDVFRDRVLAAITDDQGRVAGFTGRALHDAGPKYWNTASTPLFDKSALLYGLTPQALDRLHNGAAPVLVEGPMDVLALAQYGPDGLVPLATCGTAFGDRHGTLLADILPKWKMIIAYDNDEAGVSAAVRVGQRLSEQGWDVRCPPPRAGMDPADVAAIEGSKVLDWVAAARPTVFTAAEHQMAAARHADPHADRIAIGVRVIDYLETHWGNDNQLKQATGYVATSCGLWRPVAAPDRSQHDRPDIATGKSAARPATLPAALGNLADTRQTPAYRATRASGGSTITNRAR